MPKITIRRGGASVVSVSGRQPVGPMRAYSDPVGSPPQPTGGPEEGADTGAPSVSAPKADWVAYVESLGVDASGLTKAELVELVG